MITSYNTPLILHIAFEQRPFLILFRDLRLILSHCKEIGHLRECLRIRLIQRGINLINRFVPLRENGMTNIILLA